MSQKGKLESKDGVIFREKRVAMFFDPPSGWKYGFPCEWDHKKETLEELLKRKGYPEKDYDLARMYSRMWEEEVDK